MPVSQKMQHETKLMEKPSTRLVLAVFVLLSLLLAATGMADRSGREYLNNSMKRTLVTFGIARTINGVISVAQGTEVAIPRHGPTGAPLRASA